MPRTARVKSLDGSGWYHVCARTAGAVDEYPLDAPRYRRKLLGLIELFCKVYRCEVAGFCVMGNHYHLVARFDEQVELTREELYQRASLIYPKKLLDGWLKHKWERFNERVFDLSEFMRNVQAAFGRWFNQTTGRRGRFWAERFKSTMLEDEEAVMDCLLYIELNPLRAGISERPEEYDGSSLYHREIKKDRWLVPITELIGRKRRADAVRDYKARVYYRGLEATAANQAVIPGHVVRAEEARGFETRGAFAKRWRHFVDGLALGSEEFIRTQLDRMRAEGRYLRRRNPILQLDGRHATLREQRSNAAGF